MSDTEIEPPHAGIGYKLTSAGPDLMLIEIPEILDEHSRRHEVIKPCSSGIKLGFIIDTRHFLLCGKYDWDNITKHG